MADLNTPRPCRSGRHMFTGTQCRECQYEKTRQWILSHPERTRANKRRDYDKNVKGNPERRERVRAASLAWAQANREKQKEISACLPCNWSKHAKEVSEWVS